MLGGVNMNFCTRCGQKVEDGDQRCTNCGEIVEHVTNDIKLSEDINLALGNKQSISFIEKLKKIKLKLIILISVVVLCLVFGSVGIVRYTNAVQVKEGLVLGNKYLQEEKYEEAILAFIKVIKIEPRNIEARVGLAKAYIKTGKHGEAEKILKESISINPKKVEPYLELSKLYIIENNPVNAIKTLTDGYKATNDESIKSMLEDIKSKITLDNIDKTITLGENYSLPKEVAVKINNVEVQFPVKWDGTSVDTTNVGTNIFAGILENTDKAVKLTLNVITVASIENINSAIDQNNKYSLPSKVTAKMTDGSNMDVEVKWSPSGVDTSKAGRYSYQGTVSRYNNKIELTLNVIAIASIENINSTINQKDKYSLPLTVTAKMTDGSTRDVAVTWTPPGVDTNRAGSYSYEGTVSGYSNKLKLTLTIKSLENADDYTPEMAFQLAKKYIGAENVDDVGGGAGDSIIKNGKKYYYVRLYSKSMRESGGTGTIDFFYIAKDGSITRD
jgi:tetratricopeptide (TPR) repeat protein